MNKKNEEMVFKRQYDSLPRKNKIELRNKFVAISGMSVITFYQKIREDTFKPLESRLFEELYGQINGTNN